MFSCYLMLVHNPRVERGFVVLPDCSFPPAVTHSLTHSVIRTTGNINQKSERLGWARENLQTGSCRDTKSSHPETLTRRLGDRKYFFWFATIFVLEHSSKQLWSTSMVHADYGQLLLDGMRPEQQIRATARASPDGSNLVFGVPVRRWSAEF